MSSSLVRSFVALRFASAALGLALVAGCAVGPDYQRPAMPAMPAAFKEAAGWKAATPGDAMVRGAWWEDFHDPLLNDLESQVATANQSLLQAEANYNQARQLVRADRATLFPSISLLGSGTKAHAVVPGSSSSYLAALEGTWTPDFWGRVSRLTEADTAAAQSSAATLASARLSAQATLAQDYIALRVLDEKKRLLDNQIESYRRTLQISQNKYNVGVSARNDVISAQAQLDATRAQAIDVGVQRAAYEHAIAVLIGRAPGGLTIAVQPGLTLGVPDVPLQLPSDLLERRPDIAAAERSIAAANARVGIQTAAYYPDITLSAEGGYQGSPLDQLFRVPFRFWSLGLSASETLLDFGQRQAEVEQARAAYDASVAGYRQAVLTAFQQVEDNLAGLRIQAEEAKVQDAAVAEAAEAAKITMNEYKAGTVDYTTVVTAQVAELSVRESALAVLQSRLTETVALVEALGGGWDASVLPTPKQVRAGDSAAPGTTAAAKP
jgi:NodT family efflux transporter outer membrane factor (OMF) lipoprotein